ncbi:MAG: PD-(D/E)XK nuclease family protein, partial [Luteibaculum sp.]
MDLGFPTTKSKAENSFVAQIFEHIQKEQYALPELHIIFPGNRAGLLLKDLFRKNHSASSILLPEISTLNQLADQFSDSTTADSTELLLLLYQVYKKHMESTALDFAAFLPWGKNILADFNELDLQLANAKQIFSSLVGIKELEAWKEIDLISPSQDRFNRFWQRLFDIYQDFNALLDEKKLLYTGKKYRGLSEKDFTPEGEWIFAGFNLLSPAEQAFVAKFLDRGCLIFSSDTSFTSIPNHEAKSKLPEIYKPTRDIVYNTEWVKKKAGIKLYACSNNLEQIEGLCSVLETLSPPELDKTCVLLPDSTLLEPLLQNLPNNVEDFNATLPLSLKSQPWVAYLFRLLGFLNSKPSNQIQVFDFLSLLQYPNNQDIIEHSSFPEASIPIKHLGNYLEKEDPGFLFLQLIGAQATQISGILEQWMENFFPQENTLLQTAKKQISKSLVEFDQKLKVYSTPSLSAFTYLDLWLNDLSGQGFSTEGKPGKGLQIMGMLEVRNLDFERVFVLSVNEGLLPPSVSDHTFFANDLRKHYKLPSFQDKEKLYGFYFYQLFSHAKEAHLFYLESREKRRSRYLEQMLVELPLLEEDYPIKEIGVKPKSKISSTPQSVPLTVSEGDFTRYLDFLENRGLSPSALNAFIACPKDFFIKHIFRAPEIQALGQVLPSTLGNAVHDSLEKGYKEILGGSSGKIDLNHLPALEKACQRHSEAYIQSLGNEHSGYLKLLKAQANRLLPLWFEQEKNLVEKHGEIFILDLEKKYEAKLDLELSGKIVSVGIKGKIDRIHQVGEEIFLLDYKTGKVESGYLKTKYDDIVLNLERKELRQLLFY